jgi:ubiquinone/menaquinone biosynthesis C-methylase UbiE
MLKGFQIKHRSQAIYRINDIVRSHSDLTDIELFNLILSYLSYFPRVKNWEGRSIERSNAILSIVGDRKIETYLDYGCGSGTITKQVSRDLGISNKKTYAVDIHDDGIEDVNYIDLSKEVISDDLRCDLITAFVSFHHIQNIDHALNQIYDMLNPGG